MKSIAFVLLLVGSSAFSQTENLNLRDPQMKEGQLFVVKLIPAGKRLDILVTGKQAMQAELTDMGLKATLFVGNKQFELVPSQKNPDEPNRFSIEPYAAPFDAKTSRLKLEVKEGSKQEKFEFAPRR